MIEGRDLQERSRPHELQEHEDEGHSLPGRWVNSHELRAGDCIITRSGTRAIITEIRQHFEPAFPVSNLTIFGHHNYSVGDVGVLVHNVSVCDGTIADLRKLRADGMSEDKIKEWLRSKTDDNGNRLYNDDEIDKALGRILAPKGPVSIFGRPQVTSPGHAQKIFNMATDMANSGSYKSVYMHSKWSKILEGTGVKVSPNRLPDIAGIRIDGKIDMIEIASKTDDLTKLLERNKAIWNQLPAHLRGDIIVIDQLGNWSKVFP